MPMEMRARNKNFVIRLLDEERAELDAIASAERSTASEIVRRLVRAAYIARFGNRAGDKRPKAQK